MKMPGKEVEEDTFREKDPLEAIPETQVRETVLQEEVRIMVRLQAEGDIICRMEK